MRAWHSRLRVGSALLSRDAAHDRIRYASHHRGVSARHHVPHVAVMLWHIRPRPRRWRRVRQDLASEQTQAHYHILAQRSRVGTRRPPCLHVQDRQRANIAAKRRQAAHVHGQAARDQRRRVHTISVV